MLNDVRRWARTAAPTGRLRGSSHGHGAEGAYTELAGGLVISRRATPQWMLAIKPTAKGIDFV